MGKPDMWRRRLTLFETALQQNMLAMSKAGYRGRFAFLGCEPLYCGKRLDWNPWHGSCDLMNSELQAVNVATSRLFANMGLPDAFVDNWALAAQRPSVSLDGVHPCWTRPCGWED